MLNKEELEGSLQRVHEWIRNADEKVSIFLAFEGVVLTILFPKVYSWAESNVANFSYISLLVLIIGMVLILISLYKSASAVIPRLKKNQHHKSITYFGDIAELSLIAFREVVEKADEKQYKDELTNQIHASSIIAKKKHEQFKEAILAFAFGILLLVMSFLMVKF